MNVAPRQPLKTAAWTLWSLLCLSANMILHIHFILSDADLNNFYEALWGRRTKVSQRLFFFTFYFSDSPQETLMVFSFRFSFWKRERKEHERGHNESKKLWFMQQIPQTASLQQSLGLVTRAFLWCLALLNFCAHLKVVLVEWAVVILLCGVISAD